MSLIFLDAETFFDAEYSLSRMSTQAYILDERFKVHGWGAASLEGRPIWLTGGKATAFLERVVPTATVVAHNWAFDGAILAWRYGLRPKRVIDTVSLSRAMVGVSLRSHSLDSIAKLLLGEGKTFGLDVAKGKRELTEAELATLGSYCCNDVEITRGIFKKLLRFFPQEELPLVDWVGRAFTEPKLLLDAELLERYHAEVVAGKEAALASVGMADRTVLMSNPMFASALEALGVTPPMKLSPATGKEAFAFAKTDQGLKDLLEHENPAVQALVSARLEVKSTIEETRSKLFLEASAFGPFPMQYNYSGAMQTHRFSGGGKTNVQNLKRGGTLRDAIVAPEGFTLVVSDLSQIELRVTLALAGETEALDRLKAGEDLYSWFACLMYGLAPDAPVEKWQRQVAKSAVLGLGFGMGAKKFRLYCQQQGIKLSEEEAERAVKLYRSTFDGVPRLWRIAERALPLAAAGEAHQWPAMKPLFETGKEPLLGAPGMKLPGGLWVKYPGLRRDGGAEFVYDAQGSTQKMFGSEVVANVVQATARYICMQMLLQVQAHLPVVMTTHDEIVALVPLSKAAIAERFVRAIMSKSPEWWPELPIACEVGVNPCYGTASANKH